jgi:RNA-splicing ligase RtcB
MKNLKGKYATAKIMTDNIEEFAEEQIQFLLNDPISKGTTIRVMPDVHGGKDNVIGLTMKLKDKVAPSLVGSDIGCGVRLSYFSTKNEIDLADLDEIIKRKIPSGYHLNTDEANSHDHSYYTDYVHEIVSRMNYLDEFRMDYLKVVARKGVGTLGGGNHFIELYKVEAQEELKDPSFLYAIAVHSGSRTLGGIVYKHFQNIAKKQVHSDFSEIQKDVIETLKGQNREREIGEYLGMIKSLKKVLSESQSQIPYLDIESVEGQNYLHSMGILNEYASINRRLITNRILNDLDGCKIIRVIDKPHNYIDRYNILRKGSQSAEEDKIVLIPINMRDGMIVGVTKHIEDWNSSFPHGAGRVYSRTQAKKNITMDEFVNSMHGIYSTTVGEETLDEAPMAYKSLDSILKDVTPLLKQYQILKPIYNFKGGQEHK